MDHDDGDVLSRAAKELFGLDYLFPYQRLVISNIIEASGALTDERRGAQASDRVLAGRQIVILPTGAGKSLCFQLPAMLMRGATLVLYPILSLMADQERRLRERGLCPALLRGGQSEEQREAIFRSVKSGESRFIIANPETLLADRMKKMLPDLNIVHVVIDEAHCVSEWGESFRPAYLRIAEITGVLDKPLITAFTATASAPVLEKIERYVFGEEAGTVNRIIGNPDRSNITYAAQGALLKDLAVRDLLFKNALPAVVFCSSREGTEKLARYLRLWFNDNVRFYHAGLEREEKTAVEKWFFDSKDGILAATCAYGMGVDKSDIRTVIHRDCPPSVEAYLQESGRAGRDGLGAKAVLLWGTEDELALKRAESAENKNRVQKLLEYGRNTVKCRRETLLGLLDYTPAEPRRETPAGGCCDVCSGAASAFFREEQSLTGFFRRNRRCYSLDEAAAFLSGGEVSPDPGWSPEEAAFALRALVKMGKLKTLRYVPWKGKITV